MSPAAALGVPRPALGDGPYIEINPFLADASRNWDWFLYNGVSGGGPYTYSAFSTTTLGSAAQYASRTWYRDFGEGGLFDLRVIHTKGFDVGIYSFLLDGREIARLDGWTGGADINNLEATLATAIAIGPGRHRLDIVMSSANPGATGLKFYPAIQRMFFRRTAPNARRRLGPSLAFPTGRPAASGGQVIEVMVAFTAPNSGWNNYLNTNAMANFELYSNNAVGNSRGWDLDLGAGTWAIDLILATFSSAGVISIQIDGVTVGSINGFSGSTVYGVTKSTTFVVPNSGKHRVTLIMAAGGYGDISHLQLRQLSGRPMPHRLVNWTAGWASGHLNWSAVLDANSAYGIERDSDGGVQNAAIWWEKDLRAGNVGPRAPPREGRQPRDLLGAPRRRRGRHDRRLRRQPDGERLLDDHRDRRAVERHPQDQPGDGDEERLELGLLRDHRRDPDASEPTDQPRHGREDRERRRVDVGRREDHGDRQEPCPVGSRGPGDNDDRHHQAQRERDPLVRQPGMLWQDRRRAGDLDPARPRRRVEGERHRDDGETSHCRDRERPRFAAEQEPQRPDARRDLRDRGDRPGGRVAHPDDDREGDQPLDVADRHGGQQGEDRHEVGRGTQRPEEPHERRDCPGSAGRARRDSRSGRDRGRHGFRPDAIASRIHDQARVQ
jgi:hypothetical protein